MAAGSPRHPGNGSRRPPGNGEVRRVLAAARTALADAITAVRPGERYAAAHLAALRAAAAVLAARAQPGGPRRPTSAWRLLVVVAPEFAEWAAYFAAGAGKRAAAASGVRGAVTRREADDLLRAAATFLELVEGTVGVLPFPVDRAS